MGSEFGGTWEDPGGVFFEFAVKRALKQDQIVHMEEKLQIILYFSRECVVPVTDRVLPLLIFLPISLTAKDQIAPRVFPGYQGF